MVGGRRFVRAWLVALVILALAGTTGLTQSPGPSASVDPGRPASAGPPGSPGPSVAPVVALRWSVAGPVDPGDTALVLLLPAIGCALRRGGGPPVTTEVAETGTEVAIRVLPVPETGGSCEVGELARLAVPLGAPLGDRVIRDAGSTSPEPPLVNLVDAPETGLRYSCGGSSTFGVREILGPGLDRPDIEARRHLPGSRVVVANDEEVILLGPISARGEAEHVTLQEAGDGWQPMGWGTCSPRAVLPGLGHATWRLRGGRPEPGARRLRIWVLERACASGQRATGRIGRPRIREVDGSLLIVMGVRPVGGDCQSNPRTPHVIRLPGRLGDRPLLDGGVFPPRPRPAPSTRPG